MRQDLIQRTFNWNAKRYDRVFNLPLTTNLLFEEWEEWLNAEKDVDLCDAMIDTAFVAYGAIWKTNDVPNYEQAEGLVNSIIEISGMIPGYVIPCYILAMKENNGITIATKLLVIAMLCACQLSLMGLTDDEIARCYEVVCDSNDSKTIVKTASDVKANINKGEFFIPPEPRLQEILDGREFS